MFSLIRKRMRGGKGFTLIELLVVIIIIAILAAIAIPTFLGQRQKAQDASAKSLVRNAMTAVESAYTDTRDFSDITGGMITAIEPSIAVADDALDNCSTGPAALTADNSVDFNSDWVDAYELGTVSESDRTFGVFVNKSAVAVDGHDPGNTFYISGTAETW